MSLITFQSVSKDFGIKEVLREGSFSIEPDDKVGVIGVNGSGKSTLLKMMGGIEPIDSGQRLTKSGARLVYLPQQPDIDEDLTVLDQVFADCGEQMQLVRKYETLSHQMSQATGKELDQLMNQLATVGEKMETSGAWELETNAKIILSKLGIEDFDARIGDLSGGYRKRVALATALMSDPDLLLMDEPTNHLDAESVEWLQDYLGQFRGALVLITHDRYFLDKVTNRIIEIDRADLYTYAGNYAYYLEKKADQEASAASSQQKFKGMLRRELAWLRQGPKARSTKQNARIGRIDEMKEKIFKETQGKVEIDTAGRRIGKKVIELEEVSKSFGNRALIKDFTYEFTASDRIGIIGGNGAGKSTLMNIITGKLEPDSGSVDIGQTIHIGYFNQHSEELLEALNDQQRVMDYLKEEGSFVTTADGSQISVSQMLERFLFTSNQQYTPIHKLSGGEKRRLFLLRVLLSAPNVLILDEPTNDLDVQTLTVLEDYLESFTGCVITVSHDRYFLDRTVQNIFALEPGGNIRRYPGSYSVYLETKKKEDAAQKIEQKSAQTQKVTDTEKQKSVKPSHSSASKKASNKEKREYASLETKIPQLEAKKAELEDLLYPTPPSDYEELQELSEQIAKISNEIDTATERWMELAELIA
ncbi:ABC-F family ATP-binding cassette domain-containing protein [cf. Phormidesmis sp. LEGE 11477]|uniref:ABC-F family ATP-binding cassette domain-containing protein n=1 Tax=cf. Phormidesmis sp. LEGE 11477 TaxID=1828680 RepID=UPI00187E1392|nr:ABC-F family ATP-binding cassette domain-containing protein [cf. Phormidesmis sp. LEGE 11477]MBE9059516.1 ABC-F family ATP-binding cassette domain-containing protein [cf. Phormidesmis sp. LEGE 11477]